MADDEDSKSVWFRERLFGSGYGPSSWQGWLATAILLILVVGTGKLANALIPVYHLAGPWWLAVVALEFIYIGVYLRIVYTHRGPW
jgi:hypothetical protein